MYLMEHTPKCTVVKTGDLEESYHLNGSRNTEWPWLKKKFSHQQPCQQCWGAAASSRKTRMLFAMGQWKTTAFYCMLPSAYLGNQFCLVKPDQGSHSHRVDSVCGQHITTSLHIVELYQKVQARSGESAWNSLYFHMYSTWSTSVKQKPKNQPCLLLISYKLRWQYDDQFPPFPHTRRNTHILKEESCFLLPKHGTRKADYNSS